MNKKPLLPWETLSSKLVFDNKWYKLRQDAVRLPNGAEMDDYFVSVRDDVSIILPVTHDGKAITVTQYKHGAGYIVTELPAGFFNDNETSLVAAQRELLEETGHVAEKWTLLATTRDNPTKDNNTFYLYLAEGCTQVSGQNLDSSEEINLDFIPLEDLPTLIENGTIHVHSMISTIYLGLKKLGVKL